jgi:hypothetical protein
MLSILLLGIAALVINVLFYMQELKAIKAAFISYRKNGKSEQLGVETWRFLADISCTALVVLLAGGGLYAFLIGSVGGALISMWLWRNDLISSMKNYLLPGASYKVLA